MFYQPQSNDAPAAKESFVLLLIDYMWCFQDIFTAYTVELGRNNYFLQPFDRFSAASRAKGSTTVLHHIVLQRYNSLFRVIQVGNDWSSTIFLYQDIMDQSLTSVNEESQIYIGISLPREVVYVQPLEVFQG